MASRPCVCGYVLSVCNPLSAQAFQACRVKIATHLMLESVECSTADRALVRARDLGAVESEGGGDGVVGRRAGLATVRAGGGNGLRWVRAVGHEVRRRRETERLGVGQGGGRLGDGRVARARGGARTKAGERVGVELVLGRNGERLRRVSENRIARKRARTGDRIARLLRDRRI